MEIGVLGFEETFEVGLDARKGDWMSACFAPSAGYCEWAVIAAGAPGDPEPFGFNCPNRLAKFFQESRACAVRNPPANGVMVISQYSRLCFCANHSLVVTLLAVDGVSGHWAVRLMLRE